MAEQYLISMFCSSRWVAKLHAGALVTIDGYQVDIADKIVAHKAD